MNSDAETYYRLDASNTIIEVGGAWDAFARDNAGGHLVAGRVEGQCLLAHVTGQETRLFVTTMLDGVRRLQRPKTKAYRCDTSHVKRYMEMTITPEVGGQLLVAHRLVRTEAMLAPVFVMQVPATHHAAVTRCSSCNRLSHDGRIWCEPDDDIVAGEQVDVVHVVCRAATARICPGGTAMRSTVRTRPSCSRRRRRLCVRWVQIDHMAAVEAHPIHSSNRLVAGPSPDKVAPWSSPGRH